MLKCLVIAGYFALRKAMWRPCDIVALMYEDLQAARGGSKLDVFRVDEPRYLELHFKGFVDYLERASEIGAEESVVLHFKKKDKIKLTELEQQNSKGGDRATVTRFWVQMKNHDRLSR